MIEHEAEKNKPNIPESSGNNDLQLTNSANKVRILDVVAENLAIF